MFKALFKLEDIREVLRQNAGLDLGAGQKSEIMRLLTDVRKSLDELEKLKDDEVGDWNLVDDIEVRCREEDYINIQAIQRAGVLSPAARKALIAYGDGYSVCDWCLEPFRLDKIKRPPVEEFHAELAKFVGMDQARVMPGARRGFQAVVLSMVKPGDTVLISSLGHYTEYLAIEEARGIVKEVQAKKDIITAGAVEEKIDQVKRETKKLPALIMLDHFDYSFGNEHDVQGVGKVAKKNGVPFMYNGAYTVGVMPVEGKKWGADFVVGSGHKSFASPAPSGILATTNEFADKVFRTTKIKGDLTSRTFGVKEVELMGCTLMGANVVAMMASFPTVKERVKNWDEEVKKSNYFIKEFLKIEGSKCLSEFPRKHTLSKVDTSDGFGKVSKTHKRRGYFLSDALKKRRILGPFPGATMAWKLNTYELSWDQIKYLSNAFHEIAKENGLTIS